MAGDVARRPSAPPLPHVRGLERGRDISWTAHYETSAKVDGQLVYAVGDVHGRYDLLVKMLRAIRRDEWIRGHGRRPVVVMCGDYIDRGPASAQVLAALDWLKRRDLYELHLLKGNHEQALLDYLDDPLTAQNWLTYGGGATLASYGVRVPGAGASYDEHWNARNELLAAMPEAHLELIRSLELLVTIGDYAFCHAGVQPGVPLDKQAASDLLWIREPFLDCTSSFGKVVVHGHSWIDDQPSVARNRIGLDTGAYRTGVLTTVRIEDGRFGFLQACGQSGGYGADRRVPPSRQPA